MQSDHLPYQIEGFLLVLTIATYGLWLLIRQLRRGRPQLHIGRAIAAAAGIRLAAAAAISLLPNSRALRGPDELVFLAEAQEIRASPLLDILTGHGITPLQQWLFALQQRLFDASDLTLRVTQIGLAVAGLALLAVVVHDLVGPRAAQLAAWLLAFEPTNVFYSGYLHKEPLITFAVGVIAYGFLRMWHHRYLGALAFIFAGCAVATLSRPYIGWVLSAAAVAIVLHAATRSQQGGRATLLAATAVCFAVFAVSIALREAPAQLERLQASQEANTSDSSNLKYESVDYSTPGAIAANLPVRVSAFLLRPYPWQLQGTNQQLGAIGGVIVLLTLVSVAMSLLRNRGGIMTRAGPLIYAGVPLILAYSVISANAGTAFRLRENVTVVLICIGCALRVRHGEAHEQETRVPLHTGTPATGRLTCVGDGYVALVRGDGRAEG
ncbi:MAG: glycosyltransferase family 39 protein [Solirubrobacteraceae bacterium]